MALQRIIPIARYTAIDKAQLWVGQPLTHEQLRHLGTLLHVLNEPMPFNRKYKQRLQLNQPSEAALDYLAQRKDVHLNYVELALDLIFADEDQTQAAYDYLRRHHVKKHHRSQQVRFVGKGGTTRYSGPRSAPNVLCVYADRPSKVTGELNCAHLEWRIKGVEALKAAGISSINDLSNLDVREFWAKRLLLYSVDASKLGRRYRNAYDEKRRKRRKPLILRRGQFNYDVDYRVGCAIIYILKSTQGVIDTYRTRLNVNARLISIDVSQLLPD